MSRGGPKNSQENLSQIQFFCDRCYMHWPGTEPGPLRWHSGA